MSPHNSLMMPALQQPEWPHDRQLRLVLDQIADAPGPIDVPSCRSLQDELARAGSGEGFFLVGGDCAELFDDATPARVIKKADHLHRIADGIQTATGVWTTRIGRFGGQFAKPRSQGWEELRDGCQVPSYRGDAINGLAADERDHDPARLLAAYRCTRDAVRAVVCRDFLRWETAFHQRRELPPRTYLSHEALVLDYERALLRHGGRHASSGHYLWIGDRTRDPDHAHIAFAASIDNPVGVKLGPSAGPAHVRALADRLDPRDEHRLGRLSLIVRMGAAQCGTRLPAIVEALGPRAPEVLWVLDPMHGNGRKNAHGQKTRLLVEVMQEIRAFFAVLAAHGLRPAGLHLETTPDDVTECVHDERDLTRWLPAYQSACDPRLNPDQALAVAGLVAELLPAAVQPRSVGLRRHPRGTDRIASDPVRETPTHCEPSEP